MNGAVVALAMLVGGVGCALAEDTSGVSRELARERASRISEVRYELAYRLEPGSSSVSGEVGIRFNLKRTDPLLLDFRYGRVGSLRINGMPSAAVLDGGHLELFPASLRKGENEIRIQFTAPVAAAGAAITRFQDGDDNSEYIYTLFVPMDASMAFPCFDQPDLKARFKLTITAPDTWIAISNAAAEKIEELEPDQVRTTFQQTEPISTYLFAFAAGPFRKLEGGPGMPAIYVRDSAYERAQGEAARLAQVTSEGMKFFAEYFGQPFPFAKYDTVLIPGLAYGGMEHAGATFLREESALFRAAPTKSDLLRRDILVLHELAHQWFGDLVTMRWFDDLWLKEGLAQYMAFYALHRLAPGEQIWKRFYEWTKPAAYATDVTQGTTPVYQQIGNLADAKSAYGSIVYAKAPGVLKQLNYLLGERAFREGLRLYLSEHRYGNAEWSDLVRAFELAGGQSLRKWAEMWIRHRGLPQVEADWACEGDRLKALSLSQRDALGSRDLWPMSMQVLLYYEGQPAAQLRAHLEGRQAEVREAAGKPCPLFVFANDEDFAYGRFLLDPRSRAAVMAHLGEVSDAFERTLLWGALWESVRDAQIAPREYAELAMKLLPKETDEALARSILSRLTTALHRYMSEDRRKELLPEIEELAAQRMQQAPDSDLRIVWFRALAELAETPAGLNRLKDLLSGRLAVPGVPLRPLDRWNLVAAILGSGDADGPAVWSAERRNDPSGEGMKYAYAAEAAAPEAETKERYFGEFLKTDSRPEDWIEQSLRPFNRWNQAELTARYLKPALEALPEIKMWRKIFFVQEWLEAFLGGQTSVEARDTVRKFLSSAKLEKDLRAKVLEAADELERTVIIRQKYAH